MSNKIGFFFKESWLLMLSAVVFGLLLAATEAAWGPRIKENSLRLFNEQAATLLPEAVDFEQIEGVVLQTEEGASIPVDVRKGSKDGNTSGWIVVVEGPGFAGEISMVTAMDAGFETMKGFSVLSANETPGFGDKINIKDGFYQSQYKGAPIGEFGLVKFGDSKKIDSEIVAITGATITSQGVVDIMNAYLVPVKEQLAQKGLLQ